MKRVIIITAGCLALINALAFANDNSTDKPKRRVEINIYGRFAWGAIDLGENPIQREDAFRPFISHYFTDDTIQGRLFVLNAGFQSMLSRKQLESALRCVGLAIYDLKDGRPISRSMITSTKPMIIAPLHKLKLAKEGYFKKGKATFYSHGNNREGEYTEWYELGNLVGAKLPPGIYQLSIVKDEPSCDIEIVPSHYKYIQIHMADTPQLRAMKLCWDGIKVLRTGKKDVKTLKELTENNFSPALKIYPQLKCAQKQLAEYYHIIGENANFRKYTRMYCNAPWDAYWEEKCNERMKVLGSK